VMFLHIGEDCSVPIEDIAVILDCDVELPESTLESLNALENINIGETYRSAIVTTNRVYYSHIAKQTLRKRLQRMLMIYASESGRPMVTSSITDLL